MYRSKAWARLAIPLVVTGAFALGGAALVGPSAAASSMERGAQVAAPSQPAVRDGGDEIMLANYPGGHTIDKEIREEAPRADGYYHVDTERTIAELQELNANTHYFLMWHSPSDWQDFTEEFLPAAHEAGIDVWAYIVPPSECHADGWCSRPFETDYVAWAENIAHLSIEYENLKGWVIDDFINGANPDTFTPDYMEEITETAHDINPDLKLETVVYYKNAVKDSFYQKYASYIDGIVFPYRDEPNHNTRRTSTLPRQLDEVISYADRYGLETNLLVYTGRLGKFETPTAGYARDALATGMEYAQAGKIKGIVSYGTPHNGAQAISSENEAMYGSGRLGLFAFAGAPDPGDYGSASQTIEIDPDAERYTLNFWIMHRFYGKESTGERFAEVLINDHVIWSSDIVRGNNTDKIGRWRMSEGPLEIDRSLFDGATTATLTFRVRQEVSASVHTETSFDTIEASGFEVQNAGFESPDHWELESTHNAFIPEIVIWQEDRPTQVFNEVAAAFQRDDGGSDDASADIDGGDDEASADVDGGDDEASGDESTGADASSATSQGSTGSGSDGSSSDTGEEGATNMSADSAGAAPGNDSGGLPVTGSGLLGFGFLAVVVVAAGVGLVGYRRRIG